MQYYDLCIVGGGPVGGYVASRISKQNFKVALFEKRKQIGTPINCAGLITPKVFDYLKIDKKKVIQNEIKGANFHSPSGIELSIGEKKVKALVINREIFDKEIIKYAEKQGTKVFLQSNVLSAQRNKEKIELITSKKQEFCSKLLVGADGPYSKIRDRFALSEPSELLRGIGAEITNTKLDPDKVEIFVGKNVAPGFFAWIIPTNKKGTTARAGLCINKDTNQSPKYYFSKLLKNKSVEKYLKKAEIKQYLGGVVPLGVLKKTYSDNVLIVGDAASQVKPVSGGGIYTGILCANHCSNVIINSLNKQDYSAQFLKKYQKLWQADIGKEISLGMKFRKILKNLNDEKMDKYIKKFQNPKIIEIINKHGDIDYPSKLIKPLLKKSPSLIKLIPNVLK